MKTEKIKFSAKLGINSEKYCMYAHRSTILIVFYCLNWLTSQNERRKAKTLEETNKFISHHMFPKVQILK